MTVHVTDYKPPADAAELLDGLNPQQRQAVLHEGAPLLIVAGAGSGKTAVLTRRIAYLLAARDVGPGQILAITFTNKAAAEMRERVVALVGPRARNMWVSTFHSTCVRILRNQASLLPGLNSNFSIYDADDSRRLLLMIGKRHGPGRQAVLAAAAGQRDLQPQERAHHPEGAVAALEPGIRRAGPHRRRASSASTSGGCARPTRWTSTTSSARPSRCCSTSRRSPSTTAGGSGTSWSTSTRTPTTRSTSWSASSSGMARWAPTTVPPGELCVVGDADQSIYAFRGATIRNIEDFERDFPNATTILLEQNYRSTQNILSAANSVISRNADRREKRLWTDAGDGELIVGYVADNEHDEARVRRRRRSTRLADRGDITYNDVAVFYRTNNSSRVAGGGVHPGGYPVQGRRRRSVLRAQGDSRHRRLPARAGQPRRRGQPAAHPQHARGAASATAPRPASRCTPRTPDRPSPTRWPPPPRARFRCSTPARRRRSPASCNLLDDLRGRARRRTRRPRRGGAGPHRLPRRAGVLQRSAGPGPPGQPQRIGQRRTRIQHRPGQRRSAARMDADADEDVPETGVLAEFLERVSLVADSDEIPEQRLGRGHPDDAAHRQGPGVPGRLRHRLGGRHVPAHAGAGRPAELCEERRLAYVGITRARQRLYVTRAKVRSSWGQPMLNPESRFLREIPEHLVDWRRTDPTPSFSAPVSGRRTVRHTAAVAGARCVRRRQAAAAGARGRRPGQSRQVRPRPGRGGVRHGGVGDVAHRLRQCGPGQADAQPRAAAEAVASGPGTTAWSKSAAPEQDSPTATPESGRPATGSALRR